MCLSTHRLVGYKARGYTEASTTHPARRFNKSRIQPTTIHLITALLTEGEPESTYKVHKQPFYIMYPELNKQSILHLYTGAAAILYLYSCYLPPGQYSNNHTLGEVIGKQAKLSEIKELRHKIPEQQKHI